MPARAIDTATIAFGLVSIPVKVYSTNEPSEQVHFNLIHAGCGQRLKQSYECPKHGKVERDEMTKGYELAKGEYVEVSEEELKALEAITTDEIEIREFVPLAAIDPLLIDASYYLGPGKGGDRAYRLLRDALESAELAGIAAYPVRGKQYVVMVRPYEDGLAMHQLRYPDEVKPWSEVPIGRLPKLAPSELGLATKIIDQLRHDTFDAGHYKDEVKSRVRKLIADKAKGKEIVAPEPVEREAPVDLMAALKASLEGGAPSRRDTRTNGHATRAGAERRTAAHRTKHSKTMTPRARPHAARTRAGATRARAHARKTA